MPVFGRAFVEHGQWRRHVARACNASLALFCLATMAACTASVQGKPERLYSVDQEAAAIRKVVGPNSYRDYASATGPRKRELRNQIVNSRMRAIDLFYYDYEARLTRERQDVGFFATVAQLALTTSSTLVSSAGTKTILSAAATGLTGTKESYDKNILIDRTISVFQQQMQAQRQLVKAKIIQRLSLGVDAYPLELAQSDLEEYYRAGTLTGALLGTEQTASANLAQANAIEEQVLSVKFAETDLAPRIRSYWRANAEQKKRVETWLVDHQIHVPVTLFLNSDVYAAEQLQMVSDLNIP